MPRTQKNNYVPLCFHAPEWLLREIEQAISRKEFPNRRADSELDKMLLPGRT